MKYTAPFNQKEDDQSLQITLASATLPVVRKIPCNLILDLDEDQRLIGIEALGIKYYAGEEVLAGLDKPIVTDSEYISYDEEVDAFYWKMDAGFSADSESIDGFILLDSKNHLVGIEMPRIKKTPEAL